MTTETIQTPTPVLRPGVIYGAHDRYVCIDCAGMTATYTGVTIGGAPVTHITTAEVREWENFPGASLGPLRCECGRLQAVATEDADAPPKFVVVGEGG